MQAFAVKDCTKASPTPTKANKNSLIHHASNSTFLEPVHSTPIRITLLIFWNSPIHNYLNLLHDKNEERQTSSNHKLILA